MASLETVSVGGIDYSLQDSEARNTSSAALTRVEALEINEGRNRQSPSSFFGNDCENRADNVYQEAHAANSPFYWNSYNSSTPAGSTWYSAAMLMRTTRAVTAGTQIIPGTNCEPYPLSNYMDKIKTYVGSDGKLHFTDAWGADSALNFSSFDPINNRIHGEFPDGTTRSVTINDIKNGIIFMGFWGAEVMGYHSGTKTIIKTGSNVILANQQADYSRLGYTAVTDNSITLTYDPYGNNVFTYEGYKY